MMTAGEPISKQKKGQKPMKQLYDHLGNPKKEGDPPLGVGYDEDGCPVPDWDIEVDATHDNPDSNGCAPDPPAPRAPASRPSPPPGGGAARRSSARCTSRTTSST